VVVPSPTRAVTPRPSGGQFWGSDTRIEVSQVKCSFMVRATRRHLTHDAWRRHGRVLVYPWPMRALNIG
jgi:hypothetical protein